MYQKPEVIHYKKTPQADLDVHVFKPKGKATCAIVFYVCGGWNGFDVNKYYAQSVYLADLGALCAIAEVRVIERHGTTPRECVIDAKSAIRFVRSKSDEWGFPSDKIVSSGGSAAGHVSLAMGIVPGFEDPEEDSSISSRSNLICAFNPAVLPPLNIATSTEERINSRLEKFGGEEKLLELSPSEHVRADLPPILLMHGDNDVVTPLAETEYFHQKMLAAGNESRLCVYPNAGHGFFNYNGGNNHYFYDTLKDMQQFLVDHNYIAAVGDLDNFTYDEA